MDIGDCIVASATKNLVKHFLYFEHLDMERVDCWEISPVLQEEKRSVDPGHALPS